MTRTTNEAWDHVFDLYWPIALGVFVTIVVAIVVIVIRWRARGSDEFSGGVDERNGVEAAYAVVLILVAAGLLT